MAKKILMLDNKVVITSKGAILVDIPESTSSGAYNITTTDNDDGTQNLIITDAENNGGGGND